jgi:hypothetical protein
VIELKVIMRLFLGFLEAILLFFSRQPYLLFTLGARNRRAQGEDGRHGC